MQYEYQDISEYMDSVGAEQVFNQENINSNQNHAQIPNGGSIAKKGQQHAAAARDGPITIDTNKMKANI